MLQHIVTQYPDCPGLTMYLLFNGELVHAYTSPQISHLECMKMVFWTHYFYALWKRYLDESGHSPQWHGISHEALNIVQILVNKFISLMIVHRDHTGSMSTLSCCGSTQLKHMDTSLASTTSLLLTSHPLTSCT